MGAIDLEKCEFGVRSFVFYKNFCGRSGYSKLICEKFWAIDKLSYNREIYIFVASGVLYYYF